MKIAVSVPDDVFARADALAAERGISRSQVYTQALRAYLEDHGPDDDPVTAKLDEVLARHDTDPPAGAAARRLVESGQWEW